MSAVNSLLFQTKKNLISNLLYIIYNNRNDLTLNEDNIILNTSNNEIEDRKE